MFPVALLTMLPGLLKAAQGAKQLGTDVERTDTTPPAFSEALARQRLATASSQLPNFGYLSNRLAAGQANATQAAAMGASSGADYLSAVAAADARRIRGEETMAAQGLQNQERNKQALQGLLLKQADFQKADTNAQHQAQAGLKGSGLTNLFGGISDVASAGAYQASYDPNAVNPYDPKGLLGATGGLSRLRLGQRSM